MQLLKVKISANSSQNKIIGKFIDEKGDELVKINIKAPAINGKANEELIKFLAQEFRVKKSQVRILKGETAKIKLIIVS